MKQFVFIVVELIKDETIVRKVFSNRLAAKSYAKVCQNETANEHIILKREIVN